MPDLTIAAATALVFVLAGFVKGVIGLGLPTVSVGLLSLLMPPAQAAAILVVPSVVTNLWQMFGPRFWPLMRRMWPLLTGVCGGTWAGAGLLTSSNAGGAAGALGIALIVYSLLGLVHMPMSVPPRAEPWLAPIVGVATGVITAATGIFVIPAVPYLQALGLDKDDLVQALGISFMVSTLALAVNLTQAGALQTSLAGAAAMALVAALAGMGVGQWLRGRIRADVFRTCFFVGLLALGAHLAWRGLS